MSKVVCSLSGGMDSTTVLAMLLAEGHTVHTISFTYGSKHNKYENIAAKAVADWFNVPNVLVDMTGIFKDFKSALLLTGDAIPEGHYEADNMSATVVPMRNTFFATYLASIAESLNYDAIALGVHQGDHYIYPDCRKDYIKALDSLIYLATDRKVEVLAPVLNMDKGSMLPKGLLADKIWITLLVKLCQK